MKGQAMDQARFHEYLKAQGYSTAELIERESGLENETHTHDFAACALILEGELSVTTPSGTTTCGVGDTFELAAGIAHSECYGPQGARLLLGRRND